MATSYFSLKKLQRNKETPVSPSTAESPPATESPVSPVSPVANPDRAGADSAPVSPILNDEDEKFLERVTAIAAAPEATPPPLPARPATVVLDNGEKVKGRDAQEALMDGAEQVPLPSSPTAVDEQKRRSILSYFALAQAKFARGREKETDETDELNTDKSRKLQKEKKKEMDKSKKKDKKAREKEESKKQKDRKHKDKLGNHRDADEHVPHTAEAAKEEQDLTAILDQLNLSAANNRVFSFSKESQDLLDKFKLVLKDVINGAPTAYHDLEKLLTDSEGQLRRMYGSLPPFLQKLVQSLPAKMTGALAPELLAASAEKPGFDFKATAGTAAAAAGKKKRAGVPSLKALVSQQGAVAALLRTILNFLRLRFPALVAGTNVLMSLAVFLLLFVLWYCHKRGRETRLEQERLAAADVELELNSSVSDLEDSKLDVERREDAESSRVLREEETAQEDASSLLRDLPSVDHLPDPATLSKE